jgi:hypothetical protein
LKIKVSTGCSCVARHLNKAQSSKFNIPKQYTVAGLGFWALFFGFSP